MIDVFLRYPFLRILLPFIGGILLFYEGDTFLSDSWETGLVVLFCISIASLFVIHYYFSDYSRRWIFGGILFFACFSGSIWLTHKQVSGVSWDIPEEEVICKAKIKEEPVPKARSKMCRVFLPEYNKQAIVYVASDTIGLHAGDYLLLRARFRRPDPFGDFDYARYLRMQGYAATAYVATGDWMVIDGKERFPDLKIIALRCRTFLLAELERMIPEEDCYTIASALLLGYQDMISKEMKISFSATGASHILSVSGLHVVLLYSFLFFLLKFLGNSRSGVIFRQLIILVLIWLFALLTGLSPSVVRAAVMLSFNGIAIMIGEKGLSLNTLFSSAFFMLLYNPLYLFDIGFQLSFLAVASIVLINPLLVGLYRSENPGLRYCWEVLTVSTSAQIGTMPLTLYYFHQFPTVFLLTNLFVVPLSVVILYLLIVSLVLQVVCHPPLFFFEPINYVLRFFIAGITFLEKMPYATLTGIPMNFSGMILLYAEIIFICIGWKNRRVVYFYIACILVIFQVIYYL